MKNIIHSFLIVIITSIFFSCEINAQWIQANGPYGFIHCFAVIPNSSGGTNLFTGGETGLFLTTDNGATWTTCDTTGMTNNNVSALAVSGTNLFAGTDWGVFLSTNSGTNWTPIYAGFPALVAPQISALAVSGSSLFAGNGSGVFQSFQNGANWTTDTVGMLYKYVYALADSGTNLFAGSNGGVYSSVNKGGSWTCINSFTMDTMTFNAYTLGVCGTDLVAGGFGAESNFNGGVFITANDGANWTESNFNSPIDAIAFSGTNIFVGTSSGYNDGGVFLSDNNGVSWKAVNAAFFNSDSLDISALAVSGSYLFAGTAYGIWRISLSEIITGINNQQSNLPNRFSLSQNYPNPFNPTTIINYSIPKTSLVTIKVYDVLGREVATLVNEEKYAGNYSVQFSGSKLSSGIYFYRIQAGSFVQTKKLLLLK